MMTALAILALVVVLVSIGFTLYGVFTGCLVSSLTWLFHGDALLTIAGKLLEAVVAGISEATK